MGKILITAAIALLGSLPPSTRANGLQQRPGVDVVPVRRDSAAPRETVLRLEWVALLNPGERAGGLAIYTGLRIPVAAAVTLVTEFPLAHGWAGYRRRRSTGTSLGNPYLGVEVARAGRGSYLEFGIRFPLLGNRRAAEAGQLTDIDRWEAWVSDVVPVRSLVGYRFGTEKAFRRGPRLGRASLPSPDDALGAETGG